MQHAVLVAERGSLEQLVHETANSERVQSASFAVRIHILLEILLAELEDENEFGFGVDNIVKPDDVDMLELLHEGNLADRSRWSAFLCIEMDFLKRNDFIRGPGASLWQTRVCSASPATQ